MTITWDSGAKNAHVTLSGGDLVATNDGTAVHAPVRATEAKSTGKWYFEVTVTLSASGAIFVGVETSAASLADGKYPGSEASSWGVYSGNGNYYTGGSGVAFGSSYTTGAVMSVMIDTDADTIDFWKNGSVFGTTKTGVAGAIFPAVSVNNSDVVTVNFGDTAFAYTPPAGYTGFGLAPPAPTPGDAAVTSEPMTAYGARLAAGAVTAQAMTAVGGMNGFGACVAQPMTVSASGGHNGGAITPVAMTAAATGHAEHSGAVTTQAMTAVATGYDSSINTVAKSVPAPTLSCTAITGEVITFAGAVPAITLECHTKDARLTVPAPTLSATLLSGSIITVTARVAPPILVATLDNPAIITASMVVRPPRLSAVLLAGNTASAILTLRAPSITAQILTGNVATVFATVAAPIMAAAGYPAYTITFAGTIPAPRLNATLSAAVTAAFRTWVLNTKKSALTEYGSEWAMNSYCVFNNVVLGCTSSGIVELGTQSLDNATAISSTVRSGQDNFQSSVLKRIPRIYIDYTTGGDAQFKLITTEGGSRTYALNWNNVTGVQQRRIPVGQGPKSVRWQWEYTNVNGADFDIGAVLAYPKALRRRVL